MMSYKTVKITEVYASELDKLVASGRYSSRADVVRDALRRLLEQVKPSEPAESVPAGEPELTVEISLIRKAPHGGINSIAAHPVEHTYRTQKAARSDYELLCKMLNKFKEIKE